MTILRSPLAGETFEHVGGIYPIQLRAIWLGLLAGLGTAAALLSPVSGLSVATLIWVIGLLWRRDAIPVLAFCIAYQWIFASIGFLFMQIFGRYPGDTPIGGIALAVVYSQLAFLAIVLGIRAAHSGMPQRPVDERREYQARNLFWFVLILFSVNWVIEIAPWKISILGEQIIINALKIRYLFLFALFFAVAKSGKGYQYAVLATLYVVVPELLTGFSRFKELLFLLAIAIAGQWIPNPRSATEKGHNVRVMAIIIGLSTLLIVLGIVWSGAVKRDWRAALWEGTVVGSPLEKINEFGGILQNSVQDLDPLEGVEGLGERLSSGVAYFSLALENVPSLLPYEEGALTWRAFAHVMQPRIFFQNKEELESDSDFVRQYTGLNVAGSESGTSVGMTYIAEFYIDFGFPLMLIPLFLYGMLIGGMYRVMRWIARSDVLFNGAMAVLFTQNFMSYEGSLPKLLGGILQLFLMLTVVLYLVARFNWGGLGYRRINDAAADVYRTSSVR